ncbi:MAG: hypothetical protein PHH93_13620, partial [Prolixibacteraceae bacterium]|nr:hypothetical protein [Prolixibacteraceae bacterium]
MNIKPAVLIFALILVTVNIFAQDPTRWRGPEGNGIYQETGLMKQWPESGPEILWFFEGLGEGHSSPAFANNWIYLSGMVKDTGYIFVFDYNGKLQWKTPYGVEFTESYPGARSTPVIAG